MGLCKCPKKNMTSLFCYEHRVNVCEHCLLDNHANCVVQTYLQWLSDSDFDPNCTLCSSPMSSGEAPTVRLQCFHVYHWGCVDEWARRMPANTAPAGYTCPQCATPVFPKPNQTSLLIERLRTTLAEANWARAGLGLQLLSAEYDRPVAPQPSVVAMPEVCKCPKKNMTSLFCYGHSVNVCKHCLLNNHANCAVLQTFREMMPTKDCDPICTLCSSPMSSGESEFVKLQCLHVYHWGCVDEWARRMPANTAPDGYTCPQCATPTSLLIERLRRTLAEVNWARPGLGLPLLPEEFLRIIAPKATNFRTRAPAAAAAAAHQTPAGNYRASTPATVLSMDDGMNEYSGPIASRSEIGVRKKFGESSEDSRPLLANESYRDADEGGHFEERIRVLEQEKWRARSDIYQLAEVFLQLAERVAEVEEVAEAESPITVRPSPSSSESTPSPSSSESTPSPSSSESTPPPSRSESTPSPSSSESTPPPSRSESTPSPSSSESTPSPSSSESTPPPSRSESTPSPSRSESTPSSPRYCGFFDEEGGWEDVVYGVSCRGPLGGKFHWPLAYESYNDADEGANKYKRRPPMEWARGLWRAKYGDGAAREEGPIDCRKVLFIGFLNLLMFFMSSGMRRRSAVRPDGQSQHPCSSRRIKIIPLKNVVCSLILVASFSHCFRSILPPLKNVVCSLILPPLIQSLFPIDSSPCDTLYPNLSTVEHN